jgi:hypothetical protein
MRWCDALGSSCCSAVSSSFSGDMGTRSMANRPACSFSTSRKLSSKRCTCRTEMDMNVSVVMAARTPSRLLDATAPPWAEGRRLRAAGEARAAAKGAATSCPAASPPLVTGAGVGSGAGAASTEAALADTMMATCAVTPTADAGGLPGVSGACAAPLMVAASDAFPTGSGTMARSPTPPARSRGPSTREAPATATHAGPAATGGREYASLPAADPPATGEAPCMLPTSRDGAMKAVRAPWGGRSTAERAVGAPRSPRRPPPPSAASRSLNS